MPSDLSVLMVGIAARQANSMTARVQAGFQPNGAVPLLMTPVGGAFNGAMARSLMLWKDE